MTTTDELIGNLRDLYNEKMFKQDDLSGFFSMALYFLSNNDGNKYEELCDFAFEEANIEEIKYALYGHEKNRIKTPIDKLMWIIRYGFCQGDEERTKRFYEIISGKVAIDFNLN